MKAKPNSGNGMPWGGRPTLILALAFSVLAVSGLVAASGCAVAVRSPGFVLYTRLPPPAPLVEVVLPPPGPEYVWLNGYWYWSGAEYLWLRGHWSLPPAGGYLWVASGWMYFDGRYRFVPGRWSHPRQVPVVPYYYPRPRPVPGPVYGTQPQKRTVRPR